MTDQGFTGPKMNQVTQEKTGKVKEQVNEVTVIMDKNVKDAMARGEKLTDLEAKTSALEEGSRAFTKNTARVKSNLWYKNMKYWAILAAVIVVIILLLVLYFVPSLITGGRR